MLIKNAIRSSISFHCLFVSIYVNLGLIYFIDCLEENYQSVLHILMFLSVSCRVQLHEKLCTCKMMNCAVCKIEKNHKIIIYF